MLSKSFFRDGIPALFNCQLRVVAGHSPNAVGHYDRGGRRLSDSGQAKQTLRVLNLCLPWSNTGGKRRNYENNHRHRQLPRLFARDQLLRQRWFPADSGLGLNDIRQPRRRNRCGAGRDRIHTPALRLRTARGHQPAFCGRAARKDQDHQPSIRNGQSDTVSRYFLRSRARHRQRNSWHDVRSELRGQRPFLCQLDQQGWRDVEHGHIPHRAVYCQRRSQLHRSSD